MHLGPAALYITALWCIYRSGSAVAHTLAYVRDTQKYIFNIFVCLIIIFIEASEAIYYGSCRTRQTKIN